MMSDGFVTSISSLDWAALGWFLVAWAGYGWFSEHSRWSRDGLLGMSHRFRLDWGRQMLRREMRMTDAALVGNLMQSVSFYASTTIYIVAGLLAVLGALDQVIRFAEDLPFARETSRSLWELKLLLLLTVFVVAYFKFTWSLRQFNLLSILIGATPAGAEGDAAEVAAHRLATVNSLAGDEFNRGIRAYYFGLAAVAWFIQPWLFLGVTTIVVVVLYRRDFASPALAALRDETPRG
jgi:uncharacterized membrane protein